MRNQDLEKQLNDAFKKISRLEKFGKRHHILLFSTDCFHRGKCF